MMFEAISLTPSNAAPSVMGLAKDERYASALWQSASMPVAAVTDFGMLIVSSGSTKAADGRRRGLLIHCLWPPTVTIEVTVSSAPVPAVVGIMIDGSGFLTNRLFPTYLDASPGLVASPEATLAMSIELPPPIPTTRS